MCTEFVLRASQPDGAWRRAGAWPPAALLTPLISSFSACPDWTRIPVGVGCVSLLPHRQVSPSMAPWMSFQPVHFATRIHTFGNCMRPHSAAFFLGSWVCLCTLGYVTFPLSPMPLTYSPLALPRKSRMVKKKKSFGMLRIWKES